jgi:hypothetical protein
MTRRSPLAGHKGGGIGSIRNFCLDLTLDFPIIRFEQSPNLRTGEMWPQAHLSKADGRKTGGKKNGRFAQEGSGLDGN